MPDIKLSDDDKLYCSNCGEDSNLTYITQYACGEHWKCNECESEICYLHDNPNPPQNF